MSEPDEISNLAAEPVFLEDSILFDSVRNELSCNGNIVKLAHTESMVLKVLINYAGDIVSREAITDFAWGGRIVTDSSLAKSISNIRRALRTLGVRGDSIITIPRVGYRLTCSVSQLSYEKCDSEHGGKGDAFLVDDVHGNYNENIVGGKGLFVSSYLNRANLFIVKALLKFKIPSLILSAAFLMCASYNFFWSIEQNLDLTYLAPGYERKSLTISNKIYEVIMPSEQVLTDDYRAIISLAPSMSLVFFQKVDDIYNVSFFVNGKSSSFTFNEKNMGVAICRMKGVLSEGAHLCVM